MPRYKIYECPLCGECIGLIGRAFFWLLGEMWHKCKRKETR
jgi:hypothetical protein